MNLYSDRTCRCVVFIAAVLAVLTWSRTASLAYEDYIHDFSIKGPQKWAILPTSIVPGSFRFGWTSPEWASHKNTWGASIAVFVQTYDKEYSARELLAKNVSVVKGVNIDGQEIRVDKRVKLRVVKQQLIAVDGKPGFIMEVVGNGTGFAVGVPVNSPTTKNIVKLVPTRQRWYCVVRDKRLIGVMSTCPDSLYKKYAPTFKSTEATLKVR